MHKCESKFVNEEIAFQKQIVVVQHVGNTVLIEHGNTGITFWNQLELEM